MKKLLSVLVAVFVISACNGSARHIATVGSQGTDSVLNQLHTLERNNLCSVPGINQNLCLKPAQAVVLDKLFIQAYDVEGKIASVIKAAPDGTTPDTSALAAQLVGFISQIVTSFPQTLQPLAQTIQNGGK